VKARLVFLILKSCSANAPLRPPADIVASENAQLQPYAVFSAAGDQFVGPGEPGRLPAKTQYLVSASVWFGKLALLYGCATSANGEVVVPQGLALAIFLRFRPSFLNGAEDLTISRRVLRDLKLAEFIHGREHHIAAEMDRLGVSEWTTVAAAYEVLDNLHYGVSCIPDYFIYYRYRYVSTY